MTNKADSACIAGAYEHPLRYAPDKSIAPPSSSLQPLLAPRSIAVIGASTKPGKLGHTVVRNLVRGSFAGEIHAINTAGNSVEGQPGWRSIREVPTRVDCAFLAIPAQAIEEAVRDCAAAGVRSVIVGASGFAELGTAEGQRRQAVIAEIALAAGMRVLGPNTNGLLNLQARVSLGYNASHGEHFDAGPVSIVSHSGALFDGIAKRLRGFGAGISKFVAVGTEADVSMLDMLDELAVDAETRVIGLVVEGLSEGDRLRRLARRLAEAGKKVVVLKIGRSAEGAGAALAHSSRLAGSARAWDALMDACGFVGVRTVEALAGGCALLASAPTAPGARLLCATTSGAGGAILADFATEWGLALVPQWEGALAENIAAVPTSAPIRNPIDFGSVGDWSLFTPILHKLEAAGHTGPMAVYAHVPASPVMAREFIQGLTERRQRCNAPVSVLAPGGLGNDIEEALTQAGIPVFHDTAAFFESLACCWRVKAPAAAIESQGTSLSPQVRELLARDAAVLTELESASLLRAYGMPMVSSHSVCTADEACAAAREVGYPCVLKGMAPGVAHKFKEGLVSLDVTDDAQLKREFDRQLARTQALGVQPDTFWLVQPMRRGSLELLLGTSFEPGLGHFLVHGLGGVQTEVLDEVQLIAVPATRESIEQAVAQTRTGRLVQGADPTGNASRQVVAALLALQNLLLAGGDRIQSVDINPLLLTSQGCIAVDALVVTRAA